MVDVDTARASFIVVASQISQLGKKLTRSRITCELSEAGKVPCDLLEFPKEEEGCQLAERLRQLFNYVSSSCNDAWAQRFEPFVNELVIAAHPVDGECPALGSTMERHEIRAMNEAHVEEFDQSITDAIEASMEISRNIAVAERETLITMRESKKQETAQRAEDRKLRVEIRKQEQEELREAKANERAQQREDRRVDIARTRLEKARQLAEKRLQDAKMQLETQMAALDRVNDAVLYSMDTNQNAESVLDLVMDVVVIEEKENVEDDQDSENAENLLRFGTKELDRYVHESEADEELKHTLNLHQECELPANHEVLITEAEEKFGKLLRSHMRAQRTQRLRANLTNRLLQRYSSVLKFILNGKREYMCSPQKVRCYDLDAVFGAMVVPDIEILIAHSTELVQSLEQSCPQYLFSTFYMTLDGKTDRLV